MVNVVDELITVNATVKSIEVITIEIHFAQARNAFCYVLLLKKFLSISSELKTSNSFWAEKIVNAIGRILFLSSRTFI